MVECAPGFRVSAFSRGATIYTRHHTCGHDRSTRIVQVAPDAHEQETRVKRGGVGWDDHPAASFESALLWIALAVEMQHYLWMSAEVKGTRQQSSGCRTPELGLGLVFRVRD